MKKLLIFLLILALMLPIVSCAKPETPPSEPQDSGSDSGSDSSSDSGSDSGSDSSGNGDPIYPVIELQSDITVSSAEDSIVPQSYLYSGFWDGGHYDGVGPYEIVSGFSLSLSKLPVLYAEEAIQITTSGNHGPIEITAYSRDGNDSHKWKGNTVNDLNELSDGVWYICLDMTWEGEYIQEDQTREFKSMAYCFTLLKGVDEKSLSFQESQFGIGKYARAYQKIADYREYEAIFEDSENWMIDNSFVDCREIIEKEEFLALEVYDSKNVQNAMKPYLYRYFLESGENIFYLTVLHDDLYSKEEREDLWERIRPEHTVITEHTAEDMRTCQAEGVVDYVLDGIRYTYCDGILSEIHWESNGTHYWISFSERKVIDNAMLKSDCVLSHFLKKELATDAIAYFDELIKSEAEN